MGILVNLIAADEEELDAVGASARPLDEWSGIEVRDLDTGKVAMLHCLLTGDDFDMALALYEPVHVPVDEDGALVLRLADEALERLVQLDDEAEEQVAAELSATEEFESESWDEDEVHALVAQLAELARLAESQGQSVFVWMHPLQS